jgi:hypothetical protein
MSDAVAVGIVVCALFLLSTIARFSIEYLKMKAAYEMAARNGGRYPNPPPPRYWYD